MYYSVKQQNWSREEINYLHLGQRVDTLFKEIEKYYGAQELVLRASKLDIVEFLNSGQIEARVMALAKLLDLDTDTYTEEIDIDQVYTALDKLQEKVADMYAGKEVERELKRQIEDKIGQKYEEYVREIKLEVLKGQSFSPENSVTLRKLGELEKMEYSRLNCSALEILRPNTLAEVVGQEKAIKSLIAKLNTPYPQHIILYGPPGVGKTTCARLVLDMIKTRKENPFREDAPFIEVDGTTLRWDPRESTNPLLGSVHDPIYQGAKKELAEQGIPEPKKGLVSEAHGGILFIDEIGEMDPVLHNKLLKVMEDKRVYFESSYYDPHDERIPQYIKMMFTRGVPADFVLIGATTRSREEISPAFRARCMEVFFEPLTEDQIKDIVIISADKLKVNIDNEVAGIIARYVTDGRGANKVLADSYALALNENNSRKDRIVVSTHHVYEAIHNSRISPQVICKASDTMEIGRVLGVGAYGYRGGLIEIETIAFTAEAGKGMIRFNDTAGSMTRDSVFNAASVLRHETGENINNYDIHINIVGGGKVDGPSAGTAIYLAILSAVTGRKIRQDVAITGELSIQGKVKPVGAIYEKINGARQAGIKKLLLPRENCRELPKNIMGIRIIPIQYMKEAYEHVFAEEGQYI